MEAVDRLPFKFKVDNIREQNPYKTCYTTIDTKNGGKSRTHNALNQCCFNVGSSLGQD